MRYQIETDFQGAGFVAVPNWVAQDARLTPEALGVLVYLASLPKGWRLSPSDVRERFGFGKDRWQRIARELRDVGALVREALRGAGGRLVGELVRVRWPEASAPDQASDCDTGGRKTRQSVECDRVPENPAAGKAAKGSRKTRQTQPEKPAPYKDQRSNKGGTAEPAAVGKLARQVASDSARRQPERVRALSEASAGAERSEAAVSELSGYQRKLIRQGETVVIGGELVKPDTAGHRAWRAALQSVERCA